MKMFLLLGLLVGMGLSSGCTSDRGQAQHMSDVFFGTLFNSSVQNVQKLDVRGNGLGPPPASRFNYKCGAECRP